MLQPGLISPETRRKLWDAGRTRKTYRVGFLATEPDTLPDAVAARADFEQHRPLLAPLAVHNPYAALLLKLLDGPGQTFLEVGADVLNKPADQDVVTALVNAIGRYFQAARPAAPSLREIAAIDASVAALCGAGSGDLCALLQAVPQLAAEVRAMVFLAHIDEAIITPIFAHSDAVGTVMRKKIEPVVTPILQQFAVLRGRH